MELLLDGEIGFCLAVSSYNLSEADVLFFNGVLDYELGVQ
jgi:hypothetical protein